MLQRQWDELTGNRRVRYEEVECNEGMVLQSTDVVVMRHES